MFGRIRTGALIGSLAALCISPCHGQRGSIQVEGWEVRINDRQPPQQVIKAIGLRPGMAIGEVGAGTGRVTVWLAEKVGPDGRVYANDIDEKALRHLKARCDQAGLANVTTILGTVEDPQFPAGVLDIAFMTNTYHHLEKPVELVKNLRSSLKPNGILAIVERDPDRSEFRNEATRREDFIKQMDQAGFAVFQVETFLKEDNIYLARPKSPGR